MQITHLVISDIRAIERLEIDLAIVAGEPRKRVVLLGVNGAGKTTILDTITHAFETLGSFGSLGAATLGAADVRNVDDPSLDPEATSRTGSISLDAVLSEEDRRAIRLLFPFAPKTGRLHFDVGSGPFGDPVILGDAWGGLDEEHVEGEAMGSSDDQFLNAARTALVEPHPPCVFLPADRGILQHRDDLTLKQIMDLDPRLGCLSRSRDRFAPLAARLALATIGGRSERDRAVARMWKVIEKYFPEMPKLTSAEGMMLRFRNRSGAVIPLNALSDGERAILLIFGELALRAQRAGMVLIDELEQHLHPRWQRAILEGLVALLPAAQLILTTQSPYLAGAASDDVIKLGEWDRDGE